MESSKKESNNKKGLKEEESDKNPQKSKAKPAKRYISSPTSSSSDDEKKKTQREKSKRKKKNEAESKEIASKPDAFLDKTEKLELSVDETNKLRAQLGLKPLKVDNQNEENSKTLSEEGNKLYHDKKTDETFEHVPAKNQNDAKEEAKLRDKLNEQKDKRKLHDKFLSTKTLGGDSSDNEIDDAKKWVEKLKQKQDAEKKEKALREMDEIAVKEVAEKSIKATSAYTSKDLHGLKIEHSQKYFNEQSDIVLTLKDKNVLDENDEDVLVNVNILDQESTEKRVENKKKKPTYKPFDEFDEYGVYKDKNILDKYDEEIDGEMKKSFRLGSNGVYDGNIDKFIDEQNDRIKSKEVKLDMGIFKVANDYLTKEEQEAFKKPKKITKKIRKAIKADDLLPLEDVVSVDKKNIEKTIGQVKVEKGVTLKNLDFDYKESNEDDESPVWGNENTMTEKDLNYDDEAFEDLHKALTKIRNKTISKKNHGINQRMFEENNSEETSKLENDNEPDMDKQITLDTMSEFCRNLGKTDRKKERISDDEDNHNDLKMKTEANINDADEDEKMDFGDNDDDEDENEDDEISNKKDCIVDKNAILDDEPIVDRGLASAIKLAINKGYLEQEKKKQNARVKENISAVHYMVEEKNNYDIDDKYTRGRDRYSGPTSDFREKDNYKPDVKLEYVNESGHRMNEKEAFRYLSHRFHGKGPGKKKTEKRTNKLKEHELMNKMSSVDTPLNTVALLVEKQKKLQQPYVFLSAPKGGKVDHTTLHKS